MILENAIWSFENLLNIIEYVIPGTYFQNIFLCEVTGILDVKHPNSTDSVCFRSKWGNRKIEGKMAKVRGGTVAGRPTMHPPSTEKLRFGRTRKYKVCFIS